jgi:hypothetical protein
MSDGMFRVFAAHSGYVVYRHDWEGELPDVDAILCVTPKKVATFVCEDEAQHYCEVRNVMLVTFGTTAVNAARGDAA